MEGGGMSPRWLAAFTIICSAACAHSMSTKVHEHMTSDELLSVFHVDHPSLVPEYHLVQLTHHLARRNIPSNHPSNTLKPLNSKIPHEKTPTPKRNKWKIEKPPPSLLDDQMFKNARENIKDVDIIGDLNNTVKVHFGDGDSDEVAHVSDDVSDSDSDSEDLSDQEHIEPEQEEDTHMIKLEAFGKQLELLLKKQEGLVKKDGLKMWSLVKNETQPHGVDFEEMAEDAEDVGELYQDEASGAALLIRRDPRRDKIVVEGSIGHDLVIRPLPESLAAPAGAATDAHPSAAQDDEMFLEPGSLDDMVSIDTGLPILRRRSQRERARRALAGAGHVVIRREPAQGDHSSDYAFMEPDRLGKRFRRRRSAELEPEGGGRSKREAPYVIYPEILVIVDYDGYRLHGGDNVQIKRYFVSFWNGVDLRYKLLKGPRIRISIAGIIISRGRDATPYLERNRVGRDAIDSAAALTDMGKYLFRERRLPVYDIAVAITKLDMCRRQFANDACNRGTAGFAYVGGACVVNKRLEKVNSVAIIEDTGGFSGIIVAAHEVGHLLGAVHDGSPPPSYLGGPGAEKCRWEDGFIMSDLRHTDKGFRWSPCSVQSFHHFLNGDTATCLYNSPHEDDSLPRVLPGRLLTLDAQCRKDRGTSACFKDERVCAQLFCFDAGSGYCVAYRPAAEGSPCGDGQYCINGRCIAEHENIIPDYSQHTPSYVRPETSPFYSNATSVEDTTQPYSPPDRTQSYQRYDTTKPSEYTNGVYTSSTQTTVATANPYKFIFYTQSTTKSPYDFNYFAETKSTSYTLPSSSVTQAPYVYNKYSITSTRSPYDFHDFGRTVKTTEKSTTTTSKPYEKVTRPNPYDKSSTSYNPYDKSSTRYNPYEKATTRYSPYDKSSISYNPYQKQSTTYRPYEKSSTSYNPYDKSSTSYNPYDKSSTSYNPYDKSSTNYNPYDKSSTRYNPYDKTEKTTVKPKSGFYSKLDLDGFFNRTTTKSPFGLSFKDNNVKTLYKIGTYYSQPKNDNAIRPDANSQQVQIEPARFLYSFQANVTDSGNFTVSCSGQDSYLRLECQTPKTAAGTSK